MTYKEAYGYIEDVQRILTQNRFIFSTEVTKAMGMALEAMEKQVGEKPHFGDGQHYCECGNILKSYEEYCNLCGQKVDWNESEETSETI